MHPANTRIRWESRHSIVGLCHISAVSAVAIDGSISRSSILARGALRGLIVRSVTCRIDSRSLVDNSATCTTTDHCCCRPYYN